MLSLRFFLPLFCLTAYTDTRDIQVTDSGVSGLHRNDAIVVLYVTVRHLGKAARRAMGTAVQCCERVAEGEDCDSIDLFGGDFGIVRPGAVVNLTFLFPSLYGYNRKGSCSVKILHRDLGRSDLVELHHRIDFDTTLAADGTSDTLRGFHDPGSFVPCETPDLDPLDGCNPVDCRLKYAGYRNFYDRKTRTCQRVPVCSTDLGKELPDLVYAPESNSCRDLEQAVTEEDLELLRGGQYGVPPEETSATASSTRDIRCGTEEPHELLPLWMGLLLALWWLLVVFLCEWQNVFVRKRRRPKAELREIYSCGHNFCDLQAIELSSESNSVVCSGKVSCRT